MINPRTQLNFISMKGLVPYPEGQALQHELVEKRAADEIPDTVLFLEHEPVITRGRGLQWTSQPRERHMPVPVNLPKKISFCDSERGGDLTFHGPGQLVIYPICKLDGKGFGPNHDVAAFLRKIETVLVGALEKLGLEANTRDSATGVWIKNKKIASVGIAIRKWVTYHGAAINVINDLAPFHLISPCGFSPEVMTRLQDAAPEWTQKLNLNWRSELERVLTERFLQTPENGRLEPYDQAQLGTD